MFLPLSFGYGHSKERARRINCVSNLKQIGTANRIFAYDHNDLFAPQLSVTNGGSQEFAIDGQTFKHFQAISNELSSTKILVCPADDRKYSTNFETLRNTNLSYFTALDVSSNHLETSFLSGDHNVTNSRAFLSNVVVTVRTNDTLGWTSAIHKEAGNVGIADGSVQQVTSSRVNVLLKESGREQLLSFP
jgi:hypothetical protein